MNKELKPDWGKNTECPICGLDMNIQKEYLIFNGRSGYWFHSDCLKLTEDNNGIK